MQRCKWEIPDVALAEITYGRVITCGLRFYEPGVGRFSQVDPMGRGLNQFAYADGNPRMRIDPWGLDWTTINFVLHYFFGRGRSVNIGNVGLLDDYIADPGTQANLGYFRHVLLEEEIKKKAKRECARKRSGTKVSATLYYGTLVENHVGAENIFNPLYSIGGHWLNMQANCRLRIDCCKKTVSFQCDNSYDFDDMFTDPFSGAIFDREWDLNGGTPYWIIGRWSEPFGGVIRF